MKEKQKKETLATGKLKELRNVLKDGKYETIFYLNSNLMADIIPPENEFVNDYDGVFSKNYGMEYNNYIYNMPIDYIVDANWNNNIEYTKKDVINISTISEIKCYTYNYLSGKLSNKEYILNILRNCFGFIGDNFYDLVNNKNNFFQILDDKRIKESSYIPTKIRLGDIGIHLSDGKEYIGICVGYTNKQKPVFSICIDLDYISKYSSRKINIKNIKDIKSIKNIKGFNLLYVDEGKRFFNYYYK